LARHYTDYSPNLLKEIYDSANLQVLGWRGFYGYLLCIMVTCSVCGRGMAKPMPRGYDCGRLYCKECAEKKKVGGLGLALLCLGWFKFLVGFVAEVYGG